MQLGNTVHFNSFKWVKEELRQLLVDAQRQLEYYVDNPEEVGKLDEIIASLRQVRGTLSLVEVYGAALLSEEMEMVARALKADEIPNRENAFEVLLNASIKLPDYLETLAAGNKDVPMVLLPLLNDLRACRNASLLSENVLFFPDVSVATGTYDQAAETEGDKVKGDAAELAGKLRHSYQLGLLGWFRNQDAEDAFNRMSQVIGKLRSASKHDKSKRLWWVAMAIIESLRHNGVEGSVALKSLMGKVDRQLKHLSSVGEDQFSRELQDELTKNLLYYVARSADVSKLVAQVKANFHLDRYLPDDAELANAERQLGGPNQELLGRVSEAIQEDINQAKDALEVFVHGDRSSPQQLEPLVPLYAKIADTLGMLGLGRARENVLQQKVQLEETLSAELAPDEETLMSAASVLLGVETELEAYVNRRIDSVSANDVSKPIEDPQTVAENQRVIASLVNESLKNIALVKDAFLNFIESTDNLEHIQIVPSVLKELSGAMFVAPLDGIRSTIDNLHDYFSTTLLARRHQPESKEQDIVADAVTNIECFLEAVAENRVDSELYVTAAQEALESLRNLPKSAKPAGGLSRSDIESLGSDLEALADELRPDEELIIEDIDIEAAAQTDEFQTPVPAPSSPGVAPIARLKAVKDYSELQIIGEDEDEEIIEVFIEEALEELEKISSLFPAWRDNTTDREAVTTIRRSFHTLKGSGRLIGATLIGEFAWAIENMLNRLIDGTIKESSDLFAVIEESIAVLPQLIEQIRGNRQPVDNVFELMQRADAIAGNQVHHGGAGSVESGSDSGGGKNETRSESDESLANTIDAIDVDEVIELGEEDGSRRADENIEILDEDGAFSLEEISLEHASYEDSSMETAVQGSNEARDAEPVSSPDMTDEYMSISADPILLDIFSDEAETHLREIERISEKARQGSVSSRNLESLIRALHTLHGSSRTAKFIMIAEKAKLLEQHANHLAELGRPWDEDDLNLLSDVVQYIRGCIAHLKEHTAELSEDDNLQNRLTEIVAASERDLQVFREKKLEATGYLEPVEIDTELVEIFLEEAPEILTTIEQEMQAWKSSGYQSRHINEIMRQLHTLKGSARMASLTDLGDLSHTLESLLISVSSGKLMASPGLADELTDAADRLLGMMDLLAQGRVPTVTPEYLQRLEDIRIGKVVPGVKGEPDLANPKSVKGRDTNVTRQPVSVLKTGTELQPGLVSEAVLLETEVDAAEQQGALVQQEQIRVRADKLDNLVNFAGEANIYHSRLGQYLMDINFNLGELDQTVVRLQRQLREMEIQTEAQIASRLEREAENPYEEFDPLEMDRYSHMQQLSRSLGESANDLDNIKTTLSDLVDNSEFLLQQQSKIGTELQEELLQTRMVKFQGLASRLRRVVRQTALQLDKKVELEIIGADTEIDRSVQERMLAPLEHMLRNAVYHGIESRSERSAAGKPETGTVRIEIDRDGSYIVLNVTDDGHGIDANRIRKKAIQLGLMEPDEQKSDQEVIQYILSDGFSTAETVSQIAGRGVGMDVVDNEIKQLGGSLTIVSEPGQGTMFSIRLPLTLTINQALLVKLAEDVYAIPLVSIEGVALLTAREIEENLVGKRKDYEYAGHTYDMYYLGVMLGVGLPETLAPELRYPLLLMRSGQRRVAVHVDAMLGRREIVVKPVGPQITAVPGLSGATILADGRVALILDIAGLMRSDSMSTDTRVRPSRSTLPFNKPETEITIMVVDDSITIRKVTARILSRHRLKVITAKDGLDAVQQLQDITPDLFLMDIEMPRMDGFELATHVRSESRLQGIPIIMITSRTGEKHRERARKIGVDRYLGKPFQENELMKEINELLDSKSA